MSFLGEVCVSVRAPHGDHGAVSCVRDDETTPETPKPIHFKTLVGLTLTRCCLPASSRHVHFAPPLSQWVSACTRGTATAATTIEMKHHSSQKTRIASKKSTSDFRTGRNPGVQTKAHVTECVDIHGVTCRLWYVQLRFPDMCIRECLYFWIPAFLGLCILGSVDLALCIPACPGRWFLGPALAPRTQKWKSSNP